MYFYHKMIMVYLNRIEQIKLYDLNWANTIIKFITTFPEFAKYQEIAPFNMKPRVFNSDGPDGIFENIIYYISASGVRFSYAKKQFDKLKTFIRSGDWNYLCNNLYNFLTTNDIQNKKKNIYWCVFNWMVIHNVDKNNITIDNVLNMKQEISGLGVGFEAHMKLLFTNEDNCIEYSDINYKKGFRIVYGNVSDLDIVNRSKLFIEMGFGRLANMFMFQIYHYSNFI